MGTASTTTDLARVGFLPRFVAEIIDLIASWAATAGTTVAAWRLLEAAAVPEGAAFVLGIVLGAAVFLAYWTILHAWGNQTLGKLVIGAVVVDHDTNGHIGPARAFGRLLAETLSAMPLYLGYLWILWDPDRQGFHDKLASTIVVRKRDLVTSS